MPLKWRCSQFYAALAIQRRRALEEEGSKDGRKTGVGSILDEPCKGQHQNMKERGVCVCDLEKSWYCNTIPSSASPAHVWLIQHQSLADSQAAELDA